MLDQAQEKSMMRSLETNFAKGDKKEEHKEDEQVTSPFFKEQQLDAGERSSMNMTPNSLT